MKPVSLDDYFKRSGDTSLNHSGPIITNEHGFLVWTVTSEALIAWQVYGDAKYWDEQLQQMAKVFGLKKIQFMTRRSPKAWERKLGYKLAGYIMEKEV